jgi:hypothetical protein
MITGQILLWVLGVLAFGVGVVKRDGWCIAAGLLGQGLVLWGATAP